MKLANEVILTVKGKDETGAAFDSAKRGIGGLKGAFADVGKTAAGFLTANVITGGLNALKGQIGSVFAEAREAVEIGKQTEAVIKSTGGIAGVSAKQVAGYATSLSQVTNFSDDAIQAGENMLLTFTNIGKDVFPQATETILNMSQALGQDVTASAVQLGKALNDPIAGVTALRKVGVALTDQQRDQIKTFVESGDILSAQKVIMKELETEFGGSARATADPLKILGNAVGELKEQIGLGLLPVGLAIAKVLSTKVVPAVVAGVTHFGNFIQLIKSSLSGDVGRAAELFNQLPAPLQALALWLDKNRESIIGFIAGVRDTAVGIGQGIAAFAKWTDESGLLDTALLGIKTIAEGVREAVQLLAPVVKDVAKFISEHRSAAIALGIALGVLLVILLPIPAAILAIILAVGVLRDHWDEIKAKTLEVWQSIADFINEKLGFLVLIVKFHFDTIRNQVETAINVVRDTIKIVLALIHGDWGEAWEGMKQLVGHIVEGLVTDVLLKFAFLRDAMSGVWQAIAGGASGAFGGAKSVIMGVLDMITNAIGDAVIAIGHAVGKIPGVSGAGIRSIGEGLRGSISGGPASATDTAGNPVFGFSHGTPYVPRDMLAFLHRGEAVIPAAQNARPTTIINNYYVTSPEFHGDPQAGMAALGMMV